MENIFTKIKSLFGIKPKPAPLGVMKKKPIVSVPKAKVTAWSNHPHEQSPAFQNHIVRPAHPAPVSLSPSGPNRVPKFVHSTPKAYSGYRYYNSNWYDYSGSQIFDTDLIAELGMLILNDLGYVDQTQNYGYDPNYVDPTYQYPDQTGVSPDPSYTDNSQPNYVDPNPAPVDNSGYSDLSNQNNNSTVDSNDSVDYTPSYSAPDPSPSYSSSDSSSYSSSDSSSSYSSSDSSSSYSSSDSGSSFDSGGGSSDF